MLSKGIFLMLLYFVAVYASFDPNEICGLLSNGTRIKDPRACNAWITCIDGAPHAGTCPDNLFYDRNTYTCVNSSSIKCISSNPCASLNNESGFAADPYACNGYYYCNKGSGSHGECQSGFNFNPGTNDCIRGYPCALKMNPDSYCNILPDGVFIKDPTNCVGYQLCWKAQVLSRECPNGYYYNALKGDCDYPFNVECIETSSNLPDLPSSEYCNRTGVFVSDRNSCNGYYYCSNNDTAGIVLQHGICPTGRFFDGSNSGECVPRTNIICNYNRCVGLASDKIELVNETNDGCHGYTICQGGTSIGNGTCPDNGYFDELNQLCTNEVVNFPACATS
ncbi:peritrophin-44 [Zeugodacus cucurbitae]|uniref:Peritrophin-44 n=2 Tax=Zeugodacus cucurbitae TaxID=28588 RepID=A0A0A1WSD4_ZEUCU|nr:peritrophin-44 [Zeugodacus cucurbitae]